MGFHIYKKMKIREFLQDERGIETQVLVFILGAVILLLLIGFVTNMIGTSGDIVNKALATANATVG